MKVGIWIRVSTLDQAQGESPMHHEERARMYAKAKGWEVVEKYDLSGVSGKSIIDHPETKRMLDHVSSKTIDGLIFSKIGRFTRNVRELLELSDYFRKHDAHLISLQESIDTSTPAGKLLFTFTGALAEWEREEISERVKASVIVRAKMGKSLGGKAPYGYKWVDKRLEIDDEVAPVIKLIFETFKNFRNVKRTIRHLTGQGYSLKGNKITHTTLLRILNNPAYKGKRIVNSTRSLGNGQRWERKSADEWIIQEVPTIVSERLWRECQVVLKERNTNPPPRESGYPFGGLVKCKKCGSKMYYAYTVKKDSSQVPRYVCRFCHSKVDENELDEAFLGGLKHLVLKTDTIVHELKNKRAKLIDKENELERLKKEISKSTNRLSKLMDIFADGVISKNDFTEKYHELRGRISSMKNEVSRIQGEIDFLKVGDINTREIIASISTLPTLWKQMLNKEKIAFVKAMLSSLTYNEAKREVEVVYGVISFEKVTEPMSLRFSGGSQTRMRLLPVPDKEISIQNFRSPYGSHRFAPRGPGGSLQGSRIKK
ncbi:MAG: recombinase family protein [Desulfatiglandaceae bacterium]